MKKTNFRFSFVVILVVSLVSQFAYAQQLPDSILADFYPLNVGDTWQYKLMPIELLFTKKVVGDTLFSNGKSYKVIEITYGETISYEFQRYDSSTVYAYESVPAIEYILFKLDERVGDFWPTEYPGLCDTTLLGVLANIQEQEVFGELKTEVEVTFYCATGAIFLPDVFLVKGIGRFRSEGEGVVEVLQGAVINGKQYGNITSIGESKFYSTTDLELLSNYPNPFNSSTTIRYGIKTTQKVEIAIYDILGRKVTVLFKGLRTPGFYFTAWGGTDSKDNSVASGIYIIFSKGQHFAESRLATLLK